MTNTNDQMQVPELMDVIVRMSSGVRLCFAPVLDTVLRGLT